MTVGALHLEFVHVAFLVVLSNVYMKSFLKLSCRQCPELRQDAALWQHDRCSANADQELVDRSHDAFQTDPVTPAVLTNDLVVMPVVDILTRRRSELHVSVAAQLCAMARDLQPGKCPSTYVDRHF